MKSVFRKILIALLAILWGVSSVQAQSVNMSRYITMTVKKGKVIQLDFHGDEENTLVRIVSGTIDTTINVKSVALPKGFKTDADTMTVYGNIFDFNCAFNYGNVYGLNTDHNTQLKFLAFDNDSLTTIDVSKNTQLVELECARNYLTSLDVSHNTKLTFLNCFGNKLTSLDINNNKELNKLYYFDNPFTTATLDDIYCSLPDRKGKTPGIIRPYNGDSSKNKDIVLATNGSNATSKNWKILYFKDFSDIKGFTGTHQCGGSTSIDEAKGLPARAVYPNPVKDILNIISDTPVHSIRIYNVYGTEVLRVADTNSIDVSHLPAGVYMVRADGKVTRIIKE